MSEIEIITGTKVVAQRLANAELHFRDTIRELTDCTEEEAIKAFNVMRRLKVIRLDAGIGRFKPVHGIYMGRDALWAAIKYPDKQ